MISLYTAVGRFERRTGKDGQYPVIIVNKKVPKQLKSNKKSQKIRNCTSEKRPCKNGRKKGERGNESAFSESGNDDCIFQEESGGNNRFTQSRKIVFMRTRDFFDNTKVSKSGKNIRDFPGRKVRENGSEIFGS